MGLIIVLVLFIGAIAGGIFFQIRSKTITDIINQKEKEISSIQKEIKTLRRLRPEKSKIKTEYQRLLNFIPANPESEEEILWELGRLAEECAMKINKCSPKNNVLHFANYPGYQVSQWQVELRGDYQSITKFLGVLPHGKRFILINEMSLESISNGASNGKLNEGYQLNAQLTLDLISTAPQGKVEK